MGRGLEEMYDLKARAELDAADRVLDGSGRVLWDGDPMARVMLVKGSPGAADVESGRAISGRDGDAAGKALEALGFDPDSLIGTVSRPVTGAAPDLVARRLRLQLEAVDPSVVVALDPEAADDLARATGASLTGFGEPVEWMGRTLVAVDGLEDSLDDEAAKRSVWEQFKSLAADGRRSTPRAGASSGG